MGAGGAAESATAAGREGSKPLRVVPVALLVTYDAAFANRAARGGRATGEKP